MSTPSQLGRVSSLFAHIKQDWWKDAHDETYLWSNGDCVEIPAITEAECDSLVCIPKIWELLQGSTSTSSTKVLDLCCGQGRHSICLAKRFPSVQFHGIDQSKYLVSVAQQRAKAEKVDSNAEFEVGDARSIPTSNDGFDIVLIMGNSFGYGPSDDNQHILNEVHRVLKPGGIFVMDYVDGEWMRSNFSPSGWEWLDGGPVSPATAHKKLVALRERELSPDNKHLASREIIIDLAGPTVHQDLFYSVQLYSLDEMEKLLATAGLSMQDQDCAVITGTKREGPADLGMMEHRQLVIAQKPQLLPNKTLDPQDTDTFIHPHLFQSFDPHKGRILRVSAPVPAGTIVFADAPYALVPAIDPASKDALLCSNLMCRRRVPQDTQYVSCPNNCIPDVVWCNAKCRSGDQARHDFECAWLKEHGAVLRQKEGEYDFTMLWVVVRLLAGRQLEVDSSCKPRQRYPWDDRFKRGWQAIDNLCSNRDLWPDSKIQHWKYLIRAYFSHQPAFPPADELLTLICKEELNFFGLHPGVTGAIPPSSQVQRGPHYGLGGYPRAAMVSHSCIPNLKRVVDDRGRIVAIANRDIAANEECSIAYFDLAEHVDLEDRQRLTRDLFNFSCNCERCLREAKEMGVSLHQ